MSVGRHVAYVPFDSRRVLRAIRLVSPVDRAVAHADCYRVRVGVAVESRVDWIGEYDGANMALKAHVPLVLGGRSTIAKKLVANSAIVVETERRGLPAPIRGSAVLMRVGSDFEAASERTWSRDTQEAIESLADLQSTRGDGVEPVRVALDDGYEPYATKDHSAAAPTVSSTSYVNGSVSVTVRVPPGMTYYVKVTAHVSFVSSAVGASLLYLSIGDGTTDHDEEKEHGLDTAFNNVSTSYGGPISATTTFTLRMKKDGGGTDITASLQTISVIAAPVVGA